MVYQIVVTSMPPEKDALFHEEFRALFVAKLFVCTPKWMVKMMENPY